MKSPRNNLSSIRSRVLPRTPSIRKAVSYQGRNITEFPKLKNLDSITELNISYNKLKSLKGMNEMPNLNTLNMDSSGIISFEGAVRQPNLQSVHFQGTQLAHVDHVRLMTIIAFGTNVERVNHNRVQKEDLENAELIGDITRSFIQDGWLILGLDPLFLINPKTKERKRIYINANSAKTKEKKKPIIVRKKLKTPITNKSQTNVQLTPSNKTEIMITPHNSNEKRIDHLMQPSPIPKSSQQQPSPILISPKEVKEEEKTANHTPKKAADFAKTERSQVQEKVDLPDEISSSPMHISSDSSIAEIDDLIASPIKTSPHRPPRRHQAPDSPLVGSPLVSDSSVGSFGELPVIQWPEKRKPRRSIVPLLIEEKSDSSFNVLDLGLPDYPEKSNKE